MDRWSRLALRRAGSSSGTTQRKRVVVTSQNESWQSLWTAFAESAHWRLLSPSDWERFFAFIHECDRTGSVVSRKDVCGMIELHEPDIAPVADWLADFYEFGRKLLEAAPKPDGPPKP